MRAGRRMRRAAVVGTLGTVLAVSACSGTVRGENAVPVVSGAPMVRAEPVSEHTAELAAGLNRAGLRIFDVVARGTDDDVVLSPLSIGLAFGMADVGARGDTATALTDLFGYPVEGEQRWAAFNALDQAVASEDGPVVRMANRQFPDVAFRTVDGYDATLGEWFGAGVEPLPLKAEPEPSRDRINGWVSERTEGLVPELLPQGFLQPTSVLVLVNALYLEADWAIPFGKYPTQEEPFTRLDGSRVTVPLMHELELAGPAVERDDYAATEIPYAGGELSMLVVVPAEGRFDEVAARLADGLLEEIDGAATPGAVELFLPRFESGATVDLRAVLEGGLGVGDVFEGGDWGGIGPGIGLDAAVHAAEVAVDENGTVAAAATALGFEESGPPVPDVTVRADRPFLYLVRHVPTGAVLLVGRVMDPSG